jgi:hypothetical protein
MLFSVVVPVTDEEKFQRNVLASPGLIDGRAAASVFPVRGAWNAADAFYDGASRETFVPPWILFCHQDVFFEAGSSTLIDAALRKIPDEEARSTVIGFIGLDAGSALGGFRIVGHCTDSRDRGHGPTVLDGPETETAESIDEQAVILHRDSQLEIDPALGWHLWATDLCLQAAALREMGAGGKARVIRVPIVHNTTSPHTLPAEFTQSVEVLLKKQARRQLILASGRSEGGQPCRVKIVSLCGVFER